MAINRVSLSLLEELISNINFSNEDSNILNKSINNNQEYKNQKFDLDSWIIKYIPDAEGPQTKSNGSRYWVAPDCVFRPGDGPTMHILQLKNGAISVNCRHNTCPGSKSTGNHWHELRKHFEGNKFNSIDSSLDKELATLPRTEYGLSERFIRRYGNQSRYIENWGGKWIVFNGHFWETSECAVELLAQETIHALLREAWHLKGKEDHEQEEKIEPIASAMGDGMPESESNPEPPDVGEQSS